LRPKIRAARRVARRLARRVARRVARRRGAALGAAHAAGAAEKSIPEKKTVTPGGKVFVPNRGKLARTSRKRLMRALQANCSPILVLELTSNNR